MRRPFPVPAPAAGVLLLLLLVLLLSISAARAIDNTTLSPSSCDPAPCGGLRISYPFWLGGTHPQDCGRRAFQVTCDVGEGVAYLQNFFWRYNIREISYQNSSFRVTNVQLSNGTCDKNILFNTTSDLGLAPFNISAANRKLFFLYNCTRQPPALPPLRCGANGSFSGDSFAFLAGKYNPDDDDWRKEPALPGNCSVVSMMPVLGYEGAAAKDYEQLMNGGFLLDYSPDDACTACAESGGSCRSQPIGGGDEFSCLCPDGFRSPLPCGKLYF